MDIHVVTAGQTLASIANQYGVDATRLALNNGITNPNNLVPGQTMVIRYPNVTHVVQAGETLVSIANQYGISTIILLQNNPAVVPRNYLIEGETLVISYADESKLGEISINGYAYPFITDETLLRTLPYLTYLCIFTYGFTPAGDLIPVDDARLIQLARDYNVAPIMVLATLGPTGVFDAATAHAVFVDLNAQQRLIDQIFTTIESKNYAGVDIDFEFIQPEDAELFAQFVGRLRDRLAESGYIVSVALAPKTSATQTGTLYQGHNYELIGAAATYVLLMTYEWGYTYGPPMAVAPINKVREVLDYGVTAIPREKIFMGFPNYGYDWPLPYIRGTTAASTLGNVEAVERAARYQAPIQFDEVSQAPFFNYTAEDGVEHVVWFEDARSVDAKVRLPSEYNFRGITYWNIMKFFPQNWLVVSSLYNIIRVI
ncbi:spore cortex-lytic enzyme, N-acetylglucosaminidase SleL [Lachnospiraceae bacterium KM106-2]|nr:spore cortex-lytic enzyme, N-acetylglucosaminidase SleL [Lachnospiraceae bacterium KM106-2]